ncbi:uncharacterized protein LOC114935963 [Nylanderia fulva]|uniref:uncharacterized protein LOC114935963 n=1 Tax=Nylanderia fulva TaxID=613905 RepID=UPI0010FB0D57|nr:uncharacterized protein LOC114935963 [Nylanderia fulva]
MEFIKQHQRCINCLSAKHALYSCPSQYTCRRCQKRHHSMLHVDSGSCATASVVTSESNSPVEARGNRGAVALLASQELSHRTPVLLATARVTVRSPAGRDANVRALLDPGSEITFMSARLAQTLRLRRFQDQFSLSAICGLKAGNCKFAAQITISPQNKSEPSLTITASILPSLADYNSGLDRARCNWDHLADLALADPHFNGSDPIELLIGADIYGEIFLGEMRKGPRGQPYALNTIFGWAVSGPTNVSLQSRRTITVQHCSASTSLALDRELRRFWEIEEVPRQTVLGPEEQRCEDYFMTTHSRCSDGRYIVRLPFKRDPPINIGRSRDTAERCLKSLLRRFEINAELKQQYFNFMREYEALGHMRKASPLSEFSQCVYIPHHPVFRDGSATTHLRVVFNASSLTSSGKSLNDSLLPGPKLQTDLAAVVMRWRQFRYVYSADVEKMYRQIVVDSRDTNYQRILWVDTETERVQEYELLTVTYGMASAPFLALRVLRQLVRDEGHSYPLAVSVLTDNIYVDDVLFGADDIPLLRQAREQVCSLLRCGQFNLRKWSSNSSTLLSDIDDSDHGLACSKDLQPGEKVKVLGICWHPAKDVFQFRISCPPSVSITKRSTLSNIARIFDPLGWSAPVTITAKIFLQRLWQSQLDWDDQFPPDLADEWEVIRASLLSLDGLQFDRWVRRGSDTTACELHGFADASSQAYAAVVYLRLLSISGEVTSMLLVGKSRVAPVKSLSIPRLELAAAVLLSRLMEFVIASLHLSEVPCYCWTDSTVVLAWVTQHPSRWRTFVANRVAEIQTRLPSASWRHVPTIDNPADCASRGIPGHQLASHPLWWHGPLWLRLPISDWPVPVDPHPETSMEQNVKTQVLVAISRDPVVWDLAARYSSWTKLLRITAYVMRFISRTRGRITLPAERVESPSSLTGHEIQRATNFWVKTIQAELFARELTALRRGDALSSKSVLLPLAPYLDEDQIIRVGGRLSRAPIPAYVKHPIVLAPHPLVQLLIQDIHKRYLHAGIQLTLATLRRRYWVIRARGAVRSVIHRCVACTRERAAVPTQLMGNLPQCRVSPPARAFIHCGVDYAGPILVRAMSGRGVASRKAYIAIFVCMATRAVHLELVEGYATPAFLGAYSRFVARRGLPTAVYSDNGTTFVGADRDLTLAFRAALRDSVLLNRTASDNVEWHFLPPSAPHFGGLWEAGVRSVKHHIRRVVGAHTLTFEEFSTLLCNVEACLNSRPIAPLSDSIDTYDPLTPRHFLIGAALNSSPEPSLLQVKENRLSRWQLVRQLTERLWKLWQSDYINMLQQRGKWRHIKKPNIRVGQLVLLRNPLLPPCKWELGRVVLCHPGLDELIRVVTVKTASSEYKRPIGRLCLLPIDIEKSESADK